MESRNKMILNYCLRSGELMVFLVLDMIPDGAAGIIVRQRKPQAKH